jgi:hypothetical protein
MWTPTLSCSAVNPCRLPVSRIRLLDHRGTVSGFGDMLETAAMNAENEKK